jgi:hypothetical protein
MAVFDDDVTPPRLPDLNPYAAPEVEPTRERPEYRLPGGSYAEPFSIDSVLRRAWVVYKARLGVCLAVVLAAWGANFICSLLMGLLEPFVLRAVASQAEAVAVTIAFRLVGALFQVWVLGGQSLAMVKVARGYDAGFADLLRGGRYFFRMVGAWILFALAVGGAYAALNLPTGILYYLGQRGGVLLGVGVPCALASLVVGTIVWIRLGVFFYALVDRDCGVIESFRISIELTRGHAAEVFALTFLAGLISLLGLLALCVGFLLTYPFGVLLTAGTYVSLADEKAREAGAKPGLRSDLEFLDFEP